jgi:hypothetical protein
MTWRGGVTMSARGEIASGKGNGGDDESWADVNLTRLKMKKIYVVNSAGTNGQ